MLLVGDEMRDEMWDGTGCRGIKNIAFLKRYNLQTYSNLIVPIMRFSQAALPCQLLQSQTHDCTSKGGKHD